MGVLFGMIINFFKGKFVYMFIAVIIGGIIYFGWNRFIDLERQNEALTNHVTQLMQTLETEVERSKRVEEATERLEKADEARIQQLRGFERRLSALAADSAEAQNLLRTVIPDAFLDGLRSFQHTSRDLPGQ